MSKSGALAGVNGAAAAAAAEDSVRGAGLSRHHQRGGQISRRGLRQQVSTAGLLLMVASRYYREFQRGGPRN